LVQTDYQGFQQFKYYLKQSHSHLADVDWNKLDCSKQFRWDNGILQPSLRAVADEDAVPQDSIKYAQFDILFHQDYAVQIWATDTVFTNYDLYKRDKKGKWIVQGGTTFPYGYSDRVEYWIIEVDSLGNEIRKYRDTTQKKN
jgi:hypothetical protein